MEATADVYIDYGVRIDQIWKHRNNPKLAIKIAEIQGKHCLAYSLHFEDGNWIEESAFLKTIMLYKLTEKFEKVA